MFSLNEIFSTTLTVHIRQWQHTEERKIQQVLKEGKMSHKAIFVHKHSPGNPAHYSFKTLAVDLTLVSHLSLLTVYWFLWLHVWYCKNTCCQSGSSRLAASGQRHATNRLIRSKPGLGRTHSDRTITHKASQIGAPHSETLGMENQESIMQSVGIYTRRKSFVSTVYLLKLIFFLNNTALWFSPVLLKFIS